jgi:hypothetical protein
MNIARIFNIENEKFKKKNHELEDKVHDLEMELVSLYRRVWLYYESDIDNVQILKRLCGKFGLDEVRTVVEEYMNGQDRVDLMNRLKQKNYDEEDWVYETL